MVELFQFLQLLEIEEKGRKSPVGTSVGAALACTDRYVV